jgi:hypothetical protein
MSDTVIAYTGSGSQIARASLSASGNLAWTPPPDPNWPAQCEAIELQGSAKNIWLVIDKGSLKFNGNKFPLFDISTPFCFLAGFTLEYEDGVWSFAGAVQGKLISLILPIDSQDPLPSTEVQLQSATFANSPPQMKVTIPDGGGIMTVTVAFVVPESGDTNNWSTLAISFDGAQLSSFFEGFGTDSAYKLTFGFLIQFTSSGAIQPPSPYLEISGFNKSVTEYWNEDIAQPYQVSVPTAEPDAPITGLWSFLGSVTDWVYRSFVSMTTGKSPTVTWTPGCFTAAGSFAISFPNLFVHSGDAFQGTAALADAIPDQSITSSYQDLSGNQTGKRKINFSPWPAIVAFRVSTLEPAASQAVRLGALDLSFSTNPLQQGIYSWHVLGYVEPSQVRSLTFDRPRIQVQSLLLPVRQVQVGSEDPLPSDTGGDSMLEIESPLVIPLSNGVLSPDQDAQPYSLQLDESNPLGQKRSLTLSLKDQSEDGAGTAGVSLLILDRSPFLVARVNLPSLLGDATAANGLVAEWSNTYPNGEGWHTQSGAQPFALFLPPQGVGEQFERKAMDVGTNPIDFRLSPAAQLEIAPPVLEGATDTYFEAPWNLRRLVTSPGQNVPGSRLPSFGAELLYGLPVRVNSSQLWVAELAALTGRLASPLPSDFTAKDRADWDQTVQAFNTRLAAWMPWDGVQPNSLTLSDEVQFSLRSSADLAYPALDPQPPGTAPYPVSQNGLKGAVAWIFESENQYRSIWQQPSSTAALLADPAFSALGGWGRQRAVFLSGLTTINSQVEMGRVSTISVEQLGRIGVLWNRAKLVTVYKRTVQASDQFAGEQDPLLGRPIVRKVAEYVELLEPIRSYPESGSGAINAAFVEGSEFKSKVIAVDSSWGSDLPSGMQVPLWNPTANPNLYPKPHILLDVSIDPNTGQSSQGQEIDEPGKLVFYSNTTPGAGPNPDLWSAVQGIDYADVDTTVTANQAYRLSIHPGLGSFTWGLVSTAFPTNVVAQRTSSPISANLKNITMMRYQPGPNAAGTTPPLLQINQVLDGANSIFQEVSDYWTQASAQGVIKSRALGSYFSDLTNYVQNFSIPAGSLAKVGQAIANAGAEFLEQAASDAFASFETAQKTISDAIQNQPGSIVSVAQAQGQVLDALFGGLNVGSLRTGLTQAPSRLANIAAKLQSVQSTIQASFNQPGQTLTQLTGLQQTVAQNLQLFTSDLSQFASLLGDGFLPGWPQLSTIEARIAQPFVALENGADVTKQETQQMVLGALASLNKDVTALTAALTTIQNANLSTLLPSTIDPGTPKLSSVQSLQDAQAWLSSLPAASVINQQLERISNGLSTWLNTNISPWLPADTATMQTALSDAAQGLQSVLVVRSILGGGGFGTEQLGQLQNQFQTAVSTFLSTATSAIGSNVPSAIYNQASQILSAVRAFGAAPIAPGLTFNLPEVPAPSLDQLAYFFNSALTNVPITDGVQSLLASAAQALPGLMPIQLNVPVSSLLDRLVPNAAELAQTAISDIFNNLAGMNLSTLFSGLLPPLNAPDGINIRHSINPQTLSVTVEADIDVSFPNDVTVLNEGPILLQLSKARFEATVKIEETVGSQPVEQVNGEISGDWELQIAGLSLVTFVSTSLTFDQTGHIRFDVSPEKVHLASVMQFIADLVNSLGSPGSGLSIVFSPSPIGVTSTLDLPLPDIAGGVFAISNIRLGALFKIGLDDQNNFQFLVGMNLSEEDAPFAIVIFILGGGGWVQAQMSYTATSGASPIVSVTIGISAIAALEISLGPISGGVSISFSLFAEYSSGSSLNLGIVIVVAGHVSLLGIVEADITLLLEADYAAGQLTGRGSVSVDIKICWCFTLSIHQEVEYQFGNQQGGNRLGGEQARFAPLAKTVNTPDDFWTNASAYIDMFTV